MMFLFDRLKPGWSSNTGLIAIISLGVLFIYVDVSAASQTDDLHTRTDFQIRVMPDGAMEITETRDYRIGFFNAYFIADIKHRRLPLEGLEVALNGEVLQQRDAGPLSGDQRLSPEAFHQEYERWLEGHQQRLEQRNEAAGQLRYWRPAGGLLLLMSLGSILRRSFRKRRRRKAVRKKEATEPITHEKAEQLPLPVLKTLFDARVLQPRAQVLRLAGLGLFDLARAGYLRITSDLGAGTPEDPGLMEKLRDSARRKLLPSQINGMIQRTSIRVECTGKSGSEQLPDWQQLLLSHVEELAGNEPAELRDLFPSRSQLKRMRADGRLDEIGLEQRENQMKQLKKAFIEDFFNDLISGRNYYESRKGAVYLNAIALLTGVHLLLLGAVFLAFLLILTGLIGFTLALINRYERSVEGLRYSEYLRRTYQGLREGQLETPLPAQAYITAFLVMNWPHSYKELYNRPRTPLFKMAAPGQITEAEAPLREAGWLQLNKKAQKHPDKSLHLLHFIIQDLCYRSLMHYPDFRKERDSG
jgi:hypothetical protein